MEFLRAMLKGFCPEMSGNIRFANNLRLRNKSIFLFFTFILLSMIIGVPSGLQNNIVAQVANDRDNDGLIDEEDPCPDAHRLFATCPTESYFPSSSEDQVSLKECVITSAECTVNDILTDENGVIVCDPRELDCSSYLTSSPSANSDKSQVANPNIVKPSKTLTEPKNCNPKNTACSSRDVLVNDYGEVICNPTKSDCSSYHGGKTCNPDNTDCSPRDILINEQGEVICDPSKNDCSRYLTSVNLEPTYQMFTICNPNFEPCRSTDVIVDASYNVICNPLEADCSTYLVSGKEPLEKYASLTGGNPNAKVLHATDPPLQYCNPRGEDCTPNYRQIPGMQPWDCFTIITTDQKVCDTTPRSTMKNSIWMHPPRTPNDEFKDAQRKEIELRNERAQFENFACEFADQASERVVAFATCLNVADEALDVAGAVRGAHMSKKEIAFCGIGATNLAKNGVGINVEGHETSPLQVLDVPSYAAGKVSKLTCKVTGGVSDGIGLRDLLYKWFGRGDGKIVAKFLNDEADRIKKEMPQWCKKYGAQPNYHGWYVECWSLEFAWDECYESQKFWAMNDPDKYGEGKPIKLRNGKIVPIVYGQFEYPCNYPPIPYPIDQVCRVEPIVCTPYDNSAGN